MSDHGAFPPPQDAASPYGAGPGGYPPSYPPQRTNAGLADRLGARFLRRPEPRFGVALAGVGVVLVILGILAWAGEYASSGGSDGGPFGGGSSPSSHKFLGIALSLVVVVIGYAVAIGRRDGPLTNAGVAASALGVPLLMGFASFDDGGAGLPFSFDAVAIVSMLVWVASYALVPVVRGHVFYLTATALTLWVYLLDKIEPHLFSVAWLFPFAFSNTVGPSGGFEFQGFAPPDFSTVAGVCLVFGLAYYVTALVLDGMGRSGFALAFVVGGFAATAAGIAAAAVNLARALTGLLLILLGIALALYGAQSRRRFTTWAWSAAIGLGVMVILSKVIPDNTTAAGISLIIIGTLVVLLAAVWSQLLREPDETVVSPAPEAAGSTP